MDEEDHALFRAAMRGVRRLRTEPRMQATPPRPRPRARFARAERLAVLDEGQGFASPLEPVAETGDPLLFRREGVSDGVWRKLRTGQLRVDAQIDLHGLTAAAVEPVLRESLADALHHGTHVVRVIHGKVLRSGNRGPVLKLVASNYLQRVGAVLAFASAREVDGGSGAIHVLLDGRKTRPAPRARATIRR
jgi:DNA-nicking Smr family endonuclease